MVITGLLGALTLTSILLLIMTPPPLVREVVGLVVATDSDEAMGVIDRPATPIKPGRWAYIFIHHSNTTGGNCEGLGNLDHFVIGNGEGCDDGTIEIGKRWNEQLGASVAGVDLGENSISICLVGNFDLTAPTAVQMRQLDRLVNFLQKRYGITARAVMSQDRSGDVGGIGQFFPKVVFARHLQS
jgi:hypothetical protein